jgi:protein-S-isoprenylcysteine O-methyltransferase Ste14
MNLVLPIISIIWIVSEIVLVIFRRSGSKSENRDLGSIVWLNIVIYGSVSLAITAGMMGIGFIEGTGPAIPITGLILIVGGLIIRWTAIFTLRQYFTVNVAIQTGHRIVQKGLYKIIRHPAYLGCLISFVGLGLTMSDWISLFLLVIPTFIAFTGRIKIEEEVLMQAFGKEYAEYYERTWRLLPWIY